MKIMDNGICRDMTAEEEQIFINAHTDQPESPDMDPEAHESDYIDALNTLGVNTNEEN